MSVLRVKMRPRRIHRLKESSQIITDIVAIIVVRLAIVVVVAINNKQYDLHCIIENIFTNSSITAFIAQVYQLSSFEIPHSRVALKSMRLTGGILFIFQAHFHPRQPLYPPWRLLPAVTYVRV